MKELANLRQAPKFTLKSVLWVCLMLLLAMWTVVGVLIIGLYLYFFREPRQQIRVDISIKTRKLLVLDIDGTLVCPASSSAPDAFAIKVQEKVLYLKKRPFLSEFLHFIQQHFEVGVYTAATEEYADAVLASLNLSVRKDMRLSRTACTRVQEKYMKDLELVELDLSRVLIMDDNPETIKQKKNIVAVPSWTGEADNTLLKSMTLLRAVALASDVRDCCLDLTFF